MEIINGHNETNKTLKKNIVFEHQHDYLSNNDIYLFLTSIYDFDVTLYYIAIQEAIQNAVKYGKFPINVEITAESDHILTTVCDHGYGFNIEDKLNEIRIKGTEQLFEEIGFDTSGRGILIMFRICDEVCFNKNGTKVTLLKRF